MAEQDKNAFLLEFGNRIKTYRMQKGMTLEELANKIGYTTENARSSIQKIEAGKTDPPASKIYRLAAALEIPISFLIGADKPDKISPITNSTEKTGLMEKIELQYGKNTCEVISMYTKLDVEDQAEIRGEMKQMLKHEKYSIKEDYKHA